MTEIINKLAKIQRELKAPKNQRNNFGKYNYRSCEDILEGLKPLLGDGILTLEDAIIVVGTRYYVKATARYILGESEVVAIAYAREEETKKGMDGAQVTGAASSYARKYALNGLFAIDDTKDADSGVSHAPVAKVTPKPSLKPLSKPVSAAQAQQIINNTVAKPAPVKKSVVEAVKKSFPDARVIPHTEAEFKDEIGKATTSERLTELFTDGWVKFKETNTPAYNRLLKFTTEKKETL